MTKTEFVAAVAEKYDGKMTKTDTANVIEAVFSAVKDQLLESGDFSLRDFGTFKVTVRDARIGRNPRTGVKVNIPSKRVVKFKAAPSLVAMVN